MNIRLDVEHLRRKIGVIELNLDDARRQLASLEARIEVESVRARNEAAEPPVRDEPSTTMKAPEVPPPLPVEAFKLDEREPDVGPEPEPFHAGHEEATDLREPTVAVGKMWLQRLQLWPPDDGQSNEVRLGAWWATRLGTMLAVIGVVFFGVYVSLDTPSWVKFIELCSISAAVTVAGLWLERRIPRFGAVVFAGGLALVYFCAFAGYALPAVKVLSSPLVASGWQLVAVLVITAAAVGRRSASIATMAIGLGYVTAIFSRAGGLDDFALVTAAVLAGAAVGLKRWLNWEGPSVMAMPGAYAVYALVLSGNWAGGDAPAAQWPWLYLAGIATLFLVRDWRSTRVAHDRVGASERWFQGTNSTLATLFGVITALTLFRGQLAEFYFGAAVVLGAFASVRRAQVEGDAIGAVLVAKAAGACALGVIEAVDGRTTALALLVQAWVMLFSAKRLESRVLGVGTGIVALVAAFYFFREGVGPMALVSWQASGALAFVVGVAWLAAEGRRAISKDAFMGSTVIEVGGALIAAAAAVAAVHHVQPGGWEPALQMGVCAVLVAGLTVRRGMAPLLTGVTLMMWANAGLWQLVESAPGYTGVIGNALAVLLPGAVVGAAVGGRWARAQIPEARLGEWGVLVCVTTLVGLAHVVFALVVPVKALAVTLVLAGGIGAASPAARRCHLAWLATIGSVCGFLFWRDAGTQMEAGGWLLAALAGAWVLPFGLHASGRHRTAMEAEPASGWLVVFQMAVALLLTLEALRFFFADAGQVVALAVTALALFGFTRWPRIGVALEASWVCWAVALWAVVKMIPGSYSSGNYETRLIAAALMAWAPAVLLGSKTQSSAALWWRRKAAGVQTTIATIMALFTCVRCFHGADLLFALVAAVAIAVVVLRAGQVEASRKAATVLAVCALCAAWILTNSGRAEGWGEGLASVLAVGAAIVALPLVTGGRTGVRWFCGSAGLGLLFFVSVAQDGTLDPYATVGWGLASIAVFMTGLLARTRPYRMIGLVGLALCVPRVFLVDLDSVLHRIAAFVVLGLVLLWVGFSYHRFRHFITEESGADKSL